MLCITDHIMLLIIPDVTTSIVNKDLHHHNAAINIVKSLDKCSQLQFLEACCIKTLAFDFNFDLKTSTEIQILK